MADVISVSEARTHFYQVINRVIYKRERILISKWGKAVAVILPFEDVDIAGNGELLEAETLVTEIENSWIAGIENKLSNK